MPKKAQVASYAGTVLSTISILFSVLLIVRVVDVQDWGCGKGSDGAQELGDGQYQCLRDDGQVTLGPTSKDRMLRAMFLSFSFIFLGISLVFHYWSWRLKRKEKQAAHSADPESNPIPQGDVSQACQAQHSLDSSTPSTATAVATSPTPQGGGFYQKNSNTHASGYATGAAQQDASFQLQSVRTSTPAVDKNSQHEAHIPLDEV